MDWLHLHDIKAIHLWKDAALGAILQVRVGQHEVTALRCSFDGPGRVIHSLLVLTGDLAGTIFFDLENVSSALDLSDVVDLVAVSPSLFKAGHTDVLPKGAIIQAASKNNVFVMYGRFKNPDTNTESGMYVTIKSDDPSHPVGRAVQNIDKSDTIGVAKALVARSKKAAASP